MAGKIIEQFYDDMCANGCAPASIFDIKADGERHYATLEGDSDKEKKLSYCLNIDGDFAYGWYLNFRQGEVHKWHIKSDKKHTPEERAAWKKKAELAKAKAEKDEAERHERVKSEVNELWKGYKPANPDHPYLKRKGIKPHGIRQDGADLIVPMEDDDVIWSLQRITPDGAKYFYEGGRVSGCYFVMAEKGGRLDRLIICEGFATGASIREATDMPVKVAFNKGNLKHVAKSMRGKYPFSIIIVAADNDRR